MLFYAPQPKPCMQDSYCAMDADGTQQLHNVPMKLCHAGRVTLGRSRPHLPVCSSVRASSACESRGADRCCAEKASQSMPVLPEVLASSATCTHYAWVTGCVLHH